MTILTNLDVDEIRRLEEDRREKREANETRRNILRWLSLEDFEGTHERHFEKRFKNTGQWLLDDPRFTDWRDGAQSSLLWCHGARKLAVSYIIYIFALTHMIQRAQGKPS